MYRKALVMVMASAALCAPLIASAGFDIDPAYQQALQAKPTTVSKSGSSQPPGLVMAATSGPATPPSAVQTQAIPPVGGAVPTTNMVVTSLSGPSAAWNEKIDGFGQNESAQQALKHVVPPTGHLVAGAQFPAARKVSWSGPESRIVVARKMLADAGIEGTFEGNDLVIKVPAAALPTVAVAPAMSPSRSVDPATARRLWTMPKGVMLSDGLADWITQTGAEGEQNKWTLVWTARDGLTGDKIDYHIPGPLRFEGTIDEAVGQLIFLYRTSTKPLAVEFNKEQRLIHIKLRG